MDYTNLGLDSNLQPVNSPITNNNETRTTAYKFSSQFERNTITSMNIRDFNFSSGYGGTLTLGGTLNGNGQMVVNDSSGSARVNIDNNGIIVKNSAGVTTIDGAGVVSTTSFPSNGAIYSSPDGGGTPQIITADSTYTNVVVNSISGTFPVVLSRAAKIYVSGRADIFFYQGGTAGFGVFGKLAIDVGGTKVNEAYFAGDRYSGNTSPDGYSLSITPISIDYIGQLPAGTTNIKLQAMKTSGGTITGLDIVGFSLQYYILGT